MIGTLVLTFKTIVNIIIVISCTCVFLQCILKHLLQKNLFCYNVSFCSLICISFPGQVNHTVASPLYAQSLSLPAHLFLICSHCAGIIMHLNFFKIVLNAIIFQLT